MFGMVAIVALILTLVQPPVFPSGVPTETLTVKPVPVWTAGQLPFPPEAVIYLTDNVHQALSVMQPGAVILSPQQYEALVRGTRSDRPPPRGRAETLYGACRITGQVLRQSALQGREVAQLRLDLEFRTEVEDAVVVVPLKGARLTQAELDGGPPVWGAEWKSDEAALDAEGFTIQVKAAGAHQLTLQLLAPIARPERERRLFLERIPQAAITTLDVVVPEPAPAALVRGVGTIGVEGQPDKKARLYSLGLGVIRQIDLTWQVSAAGQNASARPALDIYSDQRVTIEEDHATSEFQLRFTSRQEKGDTLRFRLAPDVTEARVVWPPGDDPAGEAAFDRETGILVLKLHQPLADGATRGFSLWVRQDYAPRPGTAVRLATLEALDAGQGTYAGSIQVWSIPGLRVRLRATDLSEARSRETRGSGSRHVFLAAYEQGRVPGRLEAVLEPPGLLPPVAAVRPSHVLTLRPDRVQLTAEFEFTRIVRTAISECEIAWPRGFILTPPPADDPLIHEARLEPDSSQVRVRFVEPPSAPFRFRLSGTTSGGEPVTQLALPAVTLATGERLGRTEAVSLVSQEGELQIHAEELEASLREGTRGLLLAGRALTFPMLLRAPATLQVQAAPDAMLALDWKKQRPEVLSRTSVYITAEEKQIEQVMSWRWAGPPRAQLPLTIPEEFARLGDMQLEYADPVGGGKTVRSTAMLSERPGPRSTHFLELPADLLGEFRLVFRARVPSNSPGGSLTIPLASPGMDVAGGSEVRCWVDARLQATLPPGSEWKRVLTTNHHDPELAAPTLAIEIRSVEPPPLELLLGPAKESDLAEVGVERMQVQVIRQTDGVGRFRALLWIDRLRTGKISLAFPPAAEVLIERALAAGEEVNLTRMDSGQAAAYALTLPPRLLSRAFVLEVDYRARLEGAGVSGGGTLLAAPRVEGRVIHGPTHWVVEMPPDRVLLYHSPEYQPLQGRLLLPWRPGLEFIVESADGRREPVAGWSFSGDSATASLRIIHVQLRTWMLACSLLVLGAGFLLVVSPPLWRGIMAFTLVAALFVGCMVLPQAIAAGFLGSVPGLLVLAAALAWYELQKRRWRKSVLPSFAPAPAATSSSVLRSSILRRTRPPSTQEPAPPSPPQAGRELPA